MTYTVNRKYRDKKSIVIDSPVEIDSLIEEPKKKPSNKTLLDILPLWLHTTKELLFAPISLK